MEISLLVSIRSRFGESVLEGWGAGLSTGLGGGHKTQQGAGVWEEWVWVSSFHPEEQGDRTRCRSEQRVNIPRGRTGLSPRSQMGSGGSVWPRGHGQDLLARGGLCGDLVRAQTRRHSAARTDVVRAAKPGRTGSNRGMPGVHTRGVAQLGSHWARRVRLG